MLGWKREVEIIKLKGIIKGAGAGLGFILYGIAGILGMAIHIWTIIIAYSIGGLLFAIISLMLPGIAQIYWGIRIWLHTGTFFNFYCLAIAGYVCLWFLAIVIFKLIGIGKRRHKRS